MNDTYTPFDIADHAAFNEWMAPLRPLGFRSAVCLEHECMPETIEVFLPRADTASFNLAMTDRGILLDDMDEGGPSERFATVGDALAEVMRRLAV
jgi:hypothetical protein